MKATVTGVITSIEIKEKEGKVSTDILMAQPGEQKQLKVRLEGDRSKDFKLFSEVTFAGKVVLFTTQTGAGAILKA
jgi:hypothetical protein